MSFGFSIINNITAIGVQRQLNLNNSNLADSIRRLSTGLRINSAADDVAGSALSERLERKIKTLEQGSINAQDAISVVQVAEGGIEQVAKILQRLNTLATSAASAAKSDADRQLIQVEVDQIIQQINQVVAGTKFGDQALLDGSIAGVSIGVATRLDITSNVVIGAVGNQMVNTLGVGVASLLSPLSNATCFLDEAFRITITPSTVSSNSFIVNVFASATVPTGGAAPDTVPIATLIIAPTVAGNATLVPVTIASSAAGAATFVATLDFRGITVADIANMIGQSSFVTSRAFQPAVTTDNALLIQVGAGVGELIRVFSPSMKSNDLFNRQRVDVTSWLKAEGVLTQVSHALDVVSQDRSILGALQNRFTALSENNQVLTENLVASKSRITDLNVAAETTNLTKSQILVQTANAMLAQANLLPQSLLQLFR